MRRCWSPVVCCLLVLEAAGGFVSVPAVQRDYNKRSHSSKVLRWMADENTAPPVASADTDVRVNDLSSKLLLAKKSFRLLRTVSENMIFNNETADEPDKPIFSLDNFPVFKKKKYQWTSIPPLRRLTTWAFEVCDKDNTGCIDKDDLYVGILLIHLNLAKYVGAAACNPPSQKQMEELFDVIDWQRSGYLNIDGACVSFSM